MLVLEFKSHIMYIIITSTELLQLDIHLNKCV